MLRISFDLRFAFCLAMVSLGGGVLAFAGGHQNAPASSMPDSKMMPMPGHMYMTSLRPLKAGDQQKADAIVAATSSGAVSAPRSTKHAGSSNSATKAWLTDTATVVLPTPPGPTMLTKRFVASWLEMVRTASSRPTMRVSRVGSRVPWSETTFEAATGCSVMA